jgi:hypothetical protein
MTDTAQRTNPFQVTKAVDFTDEEIVRTWVDLPGGGFYGLANPRSPTPVFLLGGKGSGRTHLMRYFSAVSQQIRNPAELPQALTRDGYVGIYVRCSGLNSGRFEGKGQDAQIWADVFAYYTDLWLAQHTLGTVVDLLGTTDEFREAEAEIATGALGLFDNPPSVPVNDAQGLIAALHVLQRELDNAINNASLTRQLPVVIRCTRGVLVFDLPALIVQAIPSLSSVQFTYLLDELENLTAAQQRYTNTLLREKRGPCSFVIGSRLYGVRTQLTYASDEENKEGSEFESVYLDRTYLREKDQYGEFCLHLVSRRLADAGYIPHATEDSSPDLDVYFDSVPEDRLGVAETAFVLQRPGERVYIGKLRKKLHEGLDRNRVPGVEDQRQVDEILSAISVQDLPLVEKLNTFLLYQDWNRGNDLLAAAQEIADGAARYIGGGTSDRHQRQMSLFRADLLAQLLREYDQKQRYHGLGTFIHMSSGLPRNLVIILKNVYRWAIFDGQDPFGTEEISLDAQREGVLQSSNWFYDDAPGVGDLGREAQAGVGRVADLMRVLRFADKPVESSLSSFSVDLTALTDRARATIHAAQQWSMLMAVESGQRDRNTGAVLAKFQLSGMLAPRWDLPIYRRGTLALSESEGNSIFDAAYRGEFDGLARTRLSRLTAPFFGVRGTVNPNGEEPDHTLF